MFRILTSIAIACLLAVPLGAHAQAQTDLSKLPASKSASPFDLLAQKETRRGHRRMQRYSQSRQGSRKVNKPVHRQRGNDANRQRPPRHSVNQRRQRIGNGTRENARRYIRNQRRNSARQRAHRRGQRHAHRRSAHGHRHWHSWHGHIVTRLPSHRHRHMYRGSPYFFFDNLWYRSHSAGFIVVAPPFGLVIPFLPSDYEEVVIRNRTYLRSNGIYYSRVDDGYTVVQAPESTLDLNLLPDMPRLAVIARQDQTTEQMDQDKMDCHLRAVDQSGFDPRIEGGGVSYDNYLLRKHQYRQAISECLEDRDYEVT